MVDLIVPEVSEGEFHHVDPLRPLIVVLAHDPAEVLNHVRSVVPCLIVQLEPLGDFISSRPQWQHNRQTGAILNRHTCALSLMWCERVCCISNQRQPTLHEAWQLLHIQQIPHLQRRRVGHAQKSLDAVVEAVEYFQHALDGRFIIPVPAGIRLLGRMDAHKIQLLIVVRRVHDNPSVATEPHAELSWAPDTFAGNRMLHRPFCWDDESESRLPRIECLRVLPAGNIAPGNRVHAVRPHNQISAKSLATRRHDCGVRSIEFLDFRRQHQFRRHSFAFLGNGELLQGVM